MVLRPTVGKRIILFARAVTWLRAPEINMGTIGVSKNHETQTFWRNSLSSVSGTAEVNIILAAGFSQRLCNAPPHIPSRPMIAPIKGVQAPGAIARSDNSIIEKPVTKPSTDPKTRPLTKLRIPLKPILMTTAYAGVGDTIPTSSKPIRRIAPIAINAETKAIYFELNIGP
jgi:hypothetical protein